jgi:YVTN family beta-propeller protein
VRARLHHVVPPALVFVTCAASTVGSITGASADTSGAPSSSYNQSSYVLPFTGTGGDMVADPATGDVFVTGGPASSFVQVMSAAGQPLARIPDQSGATGLVLSADGGTLYVADQGSDSIAVIDTATLAQTASYATTGLSPVSLAVAGGNLWFTAENGLTISEVDLSTGVVSTSSVSAGYFGAALTASPSAPNVLVSGTLGSSPATVYVFDVASGAPVETAGGWLGDLDGGCDNLGGMAITPDGQSLILACAAPYYGIEASLSTMAAEQTYTTGPYPSAVAMSADGKVLIGVDDGDPTIDEFQLGASAPVAGFGDVPGAEIEGVAWSADESTSYALLASPGSANPLTFATFAQDPTLVLDAPDVVHPGAGYTVSGVLSFMGDPAVGAAVTVTRTSGTTTTTVGTFTTNASGAFNFTDQPLPVGSTATYTATAAGWSPTISATGSTDTIPAVFPLHVGSPVLVGGGSRAAVTVTGSGAKASVLDSAVGAATLGGATSLSGGVTGTVQQSDLLDATRDGGASSIDSRPVSGLGAGSVADASPIQGTSAVSMSIWVWLVSMATAAAAAASLVRRRRVRLSRRRG